MKTVSDPVDCLWHAWLLLGVFTALTERTTRNSMEQSGQFIFFLFAEILKQTTPHRARKKHSEVCLLKAAKRRSVFDETIIETDPDLVGKYWLLRTGAWSRLFSNQHADIL